MTTSIIGEMTGSERNMVRTAPEVAGIVYLSGSQRVIDLLDARGLVEYSPGSGAILTNKGMDVFRWIEQYNARLAKGEKPQTLAD